ncbi:amino acid adenylation domain-containing protein [Rhodococcus kronopolitis]|uniref:Amino acid adenylation domain-containing protein n=1 Tax=Rhodococcus kronopolitis TaxID=1460226 RepID=A0ABV9FX89_9NOCA
MEVFPLSPAQLGMWYAQHLDPEVPINIAQYVDLRGDLDFGVLDRASLAASAEFGSGFLRILERDGQPCQVVDLTIDDAMVSRDFRGESDPVAAAHEWMRADCSAPLDLLADRLIVSAALRVEDNRYFWYTRCHHIILDGFGAMNFTTRVAELYSATVEGREPAPLKAVDLRELYESEASYRESPRFTADGEYWAERIAGVEEGTSLSGRTAAPSAVNGITSAALSDDVVARLESAVRDQDSSPAGMLIAAFASYLAQVSGKEDVILTLPVTARTTAAARRSGGMMSNVVPLRLRVGVETTVAELLKQVQVAVSGALRRQRYRYEDMYRSTAAGTVERNLLGPLVNIMLFHREVSLGSMVGEFNILSTGTIEDLGVNFYQSVGGTRTHVDFETNPQLYTDDEAHQHHSRFVDFFSRFVSVDAQTPIWALNVATEAELDVMLDRWNSTAVEVPAGTLVDLVDGAAGAHAGSSAVTFEGETLTFAEFDSRVNRLARHLIGLGVGPEERVVVAARRSVEMLVGIYAVMKAGGAYVPFDPDQPVERLAAVLEIAEPVCVLTTVRDGVGVPAGVVVVEVDRVEVSGLDDGPVSDSERIHPLRSGNPAYVIFTSGSTGVPKGVAVTHEAIVNQLCWFIGEYAVTSSDVVLQKTPIVFDPSVWELFVPFIAGAHLVIARPDGHRDPEYLVSMSREWGATVLGFVPSMLAALASDPALALPSSVRALQLAGEALSPELATRVMRASAVGVNNAYGPAETTLTSVHYWCDGAEADSMPIGRPVWNTQAYVLDSRLRPVLPGVAGEVYLAGRQVSRGYHGHPDRTAERFVPNPFGDAGSVMYRTGDLARWRVDGQMEYLGRTDFQVKLRGQRIELGEIESALERVGGVSQAVVVLRSTVSSGDQLVGYVVLDSGASLTSSVLRERVAESLPGYMVPSTVMVLEAFPLNTSGKLDRKLLPEPVFEVRVFRAPSTPVEEVVAAVFAEVLGVEAVGLDDDFFELGGNSLIAMQVVARIGAALDAQVPVRVLFEVSTVEALAARVESQVGAGGRLALVAGVRPERVPLSLAQSRMWFLNQYDTAAATYNLPLVVRLAGRTDIPALRAALFDVLGRHESLRTVFPESADGVHQVILPVAEVDLDVALQVVTEAELTTELMEFASGGFDVAEEIPFRVRLFAVGADELVVALVVHHIAADGMSWAVLARDVMTAYTARAEGVAPGWAPLRVQYADYSVWQREVLGDEKDSDSLSAKQIEYWRGALAGIPDQLDLPSDRIRPAVQSFHGGRVGFTIEEGIVRSLTTLARAQGVTPFMVVHAALSVLLSRLSGTTDIAVGTPVAGRGEQALDDVIGMFVNTLVLRTEVDPNVSFTDLLARVRDADLSAFSHADVPFERLVQVLNPARSTARHPLFQVVLSFENMGETTLELPGLSVSAGEVQVDVSKFDLQLTLSESVDEHGRPSGMAAEFTYATDLFDRSTIDSFGERFLRVLSAVVADPAVVVGDIDLLAAAERELVLSQWNSSGVDAGSDATLVDLFDVAARQFPDRIALRYLDDGLSYRALDERANRLARQLISVGVGPESLVAVALPRSLDLVVALLAVVKAGGGYLPVDPNYPADRIAYMLTDAHPVCLLTGSDVELVRPDGLPVLELDRVDLSALSADSVTDADRVAPLTPANVAYVIYTSGSTGRPKGVVVPHLNVGRLMRNTESVYGFDESDVWTMFHSYAFDFSVWELWGPLLYGGTLVVVDYFTSRSPEQFLELLARERVTVLNQTPSAFYQLAEADRVAEPSGRDLALRYVIFGGEALELRRLTDWFARRGDGMSGSAGPRLVNMYGITETTVHVSYRGIDEPTAATASASLVGQAVAGLQVYVLDSRLRPVPVGVPGEMYVAGVQLARGYLGQPALTGSRFVANPFGDDGSLLYRSGDLARWGGDGDLEYLGRADDQVKVRGFRIELGEIEAAVLAQERVGQVAVVVREDTPGDVRLVAYVVASTEALDVPSVRGGVSALLPEYMVPSAFVVLDEIPLTSNGKLDRKSLPAPVFETTAFRAPSNPVEEIVAGVFAAVLGAERVGLDDDFFGLGGNSLLATQVVARIGAALDSKVPVRALFEASTVEALAANLDPHRGEGGRAQLVAQDRPGQLPLSLAQQRMWFLNRFDGASAAYNIPMAIRLSGRLDVAALQVALGDVFTRHESLRTRYPETASGPIQVIIPAAQSIPDLMPDRVAADQLPGRLAELMSTQFDVTAEVPVRIRLFEVEPAERPEDTEYVLASVVHHISADGSSMRPLVRDLMTAYSARIDGAEPGWAPLPVQYADYALWQRQILGRDDDENSVAAQQISYWRDALAELPDQLSLPTDRPRPPVQSFRGGRVAFEVDARAHRGLSDLARTQGSTLFMAAHSAFAVLLARLSGTADIAVGTPIAGRGEAELDDLVGMFVNTLVFRTQVDAGAGFADMVAAVREADLQAFAHADVPFERLVEVLNPARSTARHPLFQVGFSFQNYAQASLELPGLTVTALDPDIETAQFDLQLVLIDRYDEDGAPAGIDATFSYAADLFDESTVTGFAERFVRLIDAVVADPSAPVGDLDLLGDAELITILGGWNSTAEPVEDVSLADLFDRQVALAPDAPALWFEGLELSYGEFDARVNRLARRLIAQGVGPESLVVLAMRRSIELVVGMYAVVKAGGAYVPVDPDHPAERIAHILDTAAPSCVLSTERDGFTVDGVTVLHVDALDLAGFSDAPVRSSERIAPLLPQHPAYVIFTSGSTGRPKGVTVSHQAIVNQLAWMRFEFCLDATDSALLKTAATFDLSVWEFWAALVTGGRLVIARPGGQQDPDYLLALLREQRVTTLHAVPSMLTMLSTVAAGTEISGDLRRVLAIGEALPAATAQSFLAANSAELVNLYGPTEAAVSVTAHRVTGDDRASVPIGRGEWNTLLYVLDRRLNPVPAGVPGELYLAGVQLARGYHGRADLTADRFVANPFGLPGERMYRTGDLVSWRSGGDLEYLERSDFQVKVRGFRIELGEIEAVLARDEAVGAVVVTARADAQGTDQLVAYVVPAAGATVDAARLEAHAQSGLPTYMVPAAFVFLDALPLTVNGKLDRAALPAPEFALVEFRAPVTTAERVVADVFTELLAVDLVGLDDDFFALGGNSLVATQVAARLGEAFDTRVPVAWLFEASTVGALAARVAEVAGVGGRRALTVMERPDEIPLSLAQQRMWVVNRMMPDSAAYNIPVAIRLSGLLDAPALESAVRDVMKRHEVLRTVYPDGTDGPVQVVLPVDVVSLPLAPVQVTEQTLPDRLVELVSAGFDVTTQVPVRASLFELSPTEYVLAVTVHHISADGFSMGPLTRDVMMAYSSRVEGREPGWAPLAVQYVDYSLWQREVLGSEEAPDSLVSRQIDYWSNELVGVPEQLELPTDHPRPARQTMRGGSFEFTIGAELAGRLSAIAREHNSTVFMVVHSAFAVLLAKMSGSTDIAIGTPVAGRGERVLDDLIGMFVNTVVLRTEVGSGMTFSELLVQARRKDLAAFDHADVPFERLVDVVGRERSTAYPPLFQVMFAFQNMTTRSLQLPGLEVSAIDSGFEQAKFDLQLTGQETFDDLGRLVGIPMQFTYATDLFLPETIALFAGRLARILEAVAADPSVVLRSIDILTDQERSRFARKPALTVKDLPELVAAAAAVAPDAVALTHDGREVTYGQLGTKLATVSKSMGAALKPEALVTVSLSGLLPGILPALGPEGHAKAMDSLVAESRSIVEKAQSCILE